MDTVVGEYGVHLVRHRGDEMPQEVSRNLGGSLLVKLDKGELGGAVDRDEQIELALLGAALGEIDVEVADGVGLELAPVRLVAFDSRKL